MPASSSAIPVPAAVSRSPASVSAVKPKAAPVTQEKLHIAEQAMTWSNWYQHFNWLHIPLLVGTPLIGIYGAFTTQLQMKTLVWAVIYYFMTGFGITAGYHRLWSHRSYTASLPLRLFLAAVGGGAVEGSARWWSRDHRAHHRYTDTEKDPYSVRKGLLYSHLGWMIMRQNPKKIGRTDISDLNTDPIIVWQHRNYLLVAIVMGFLFPTLVAGLGWGDWRGGYFYAGVLRLIFVHHATFCVNSLAHWLGDQPFDDRHSPRDHIFTAFMTLGEGYHNFHHEFPSDYRNAIKWWQYDPTKWLIAVCKFVGLASDLKEFSQNEIHKGMVQQQQKKLDRWRAKLNWGVPMDQLPVLEYDDFETQAKANNWILVAGVIHDASKFIADHPGGRALITGFIGKDATAAFNGGVYDHSNAAHNLLSTMRVAVVRGGLEVEIWRSKQKTIENPNVDLKKDTQGQTITRAAAQVTRIAPPFTAAPAN